ncbi:MAG: ABC transporter ATP-binding protein/permease [Lactobacillales bacterium]|jgi:ATP-binding cassette subfamily C protein|nr:ABC transporter ATP-binding protein/permease [Lactobacillales bacterium]
MKFLLEKNKAFFFIIAVMKVIISLLNVLFSLILERLINIAINRDLSEFLQMILFTIIYIFMCTLVDYFSSISQNFFLRNIMVNLKEKYFSGILHKDIVNFNKVNTANYISNLSNDISLIEREYFLNILNLIEEVAALTIATMLLFTINIYVALITYLLILFLIMLPLIFNKKVQKKNLQYSTTQEKFTSNIKDYFSGFNVIKEFNIEHAIFEKFKSSNTGVEKKKMDLNNLNTMIKSFSNFFSFLVNFVSFGVGGYFVTKNILTIGALIAIIQLTNSIFNPIVTISARISGIKGMSVIINKLKKIMEESNCLKNKIDMKIDGFDNKIECKNLYFSYDGKNDVLKNINITFEKGKKYAIIGKSGSGKSTLCNLLLKHYTTFEGEILIDGIDIRKINKQSLTNLISIVPQNIFIFNATLKENIKLYCDFSEYDFFSASKKACLNDIMKDADKLIQESGENLSGGEKQRVAIARALIRNSPILVIDEGTSALDNITASVIDRDLLELKEITVISIIHKLDENTLKKYDQIILIDEGSILERGNFDDLVNNYSFFYANLYSDSIN